MAKATGDIHVDVMVLGSWGSQQRLDLLLCSSNNCDDSCKADIQTLVVNGVMTPSQLELLTVTSAPSGLTRRLQAARTAPMWLGLLDDNMPRMRRGCLRELAPFPGAAPQSRVPGLTGIAGIQHHRLTVVSLWIMRPCSLYNLSLDHCASLAFLRSSIPEIVQLSKQVCPYMLGWSENGLNPRNTTDSTTPRYRSGEAGD